MSGGHRRIHNGRKAPQTNKFVKEDMPKFGKDLLNYSGRTVKLIVPSTNLDLPENPSADSVRQKKRPCQSFCQWD